MSTPITPPEATVHVVDDDAAMRRSVVYLVESVGWHAVGHADAAAFLAAVRPGEPGCLVLDVRMPAMSGLELQRALKVRGVALPIVFITGHGDVEMAVQAMKDGAFDFIEKPFKDQALLDAVAAAMRASQAAAAQAGAHQGTRERYESLTPRERAVALRMARGLASKVIARELDISDKTVQVHRNHVLEKMGVHSAAELAHRLGQIDPTLMRLDG